MADIAATDVTYTVVSQTRTGGPRHRKDLILTVAFGNNALTYPTGGVPLTASKLGCPNNIDVLRILDQGANAKGYKFEWDATNNKILVTVAAALAAHTHDLFLNDADQTDGATTRVNAATNKLGTNTGTDVTVTGVADSTGHGGVVQVAATPAAALVQHANATFVPNPATLTVQVIGY